MVNPKDDAYNFDLYTNGEATLELNVIQFRVFKTHNPNWRLCTPEEKEQYRKQKEGEQHEN